MQQNCRIEDRGTHLVVVNDNPQRRNALTPGFYEGMRTALAQAAAEPRIAAVVLTGAEGFFCAGGDLTLLMTAQEMTHSRRRAEIEDLQSLIRAMLDCPRPVIAAVEGGAAGAGFSLALACDLVVAAQDARFTASYVNAGLIPDGGLTGSLTAALPPALVAEICLLGRPVEAQRLFDLGAINALAEPGGALAAAEALAQRLAQGPAEAQVGIKALLTGARAALMEAQLDAEVEPMAVALGSAEAGEGIAAFLGKRPPDFAALRRR
ncbi:oxepin-CoA hydrolase, alternative type [Paracoccus chinensis]|uniref:Enoyl-CoA hydratase n=1 Tax=Paracoccus chinensis TaxID=525640 RepID=A0A1G9HY45_9RHOB|nr:enoyl-CoA hydratase family protein [Paracoccus chinensis]SDL17493.1 Enoyl-CoA hydratase [Paracoccus chinensis]